MTRREKYEEILKVHSIYCEDPEDILNAVSEMFEFEAKFLRETEPYAINTIRNYEHVAHETWEICNDLDEEIKERSGDDNDE